MDKYNELIRCFVKACYNSILAQLTIKQGIYG